MPTNIRINEHLKSAPHDAALLKTFIGQAHIAGTGPEGKTCRDCQYWQSKDPKRARYSFKHAAKPGELKPSRCKYPIMNKAPRTIPHDAGACRFFEQADQPLPVKIDPPPPKPKRESKTRTKRK